MNERQTPFDRLGGEVSVRAIAEAFYTHMDLHEPHLARLHKLDSDGRVHPGSRERFALFFIGWLGGPQTYMELHGHPRLRMRHEHVQIDAEMRDAWMRAMSAALDAATIDDDVREALRSKLTDICEFLRNV